jgi:hypothetical protein
MSNVAAEGGDGFEESVDDDLAVAAVAASYTIDGGDDSGEGKDEASDVAVVAEEETVASRNSSRSKSGKGGGRGGGSKVLELSAKTTKIMSAYQEYLTEIATEFPVEDDEEYYSAGRGDSGMDRAATTSVAAARGRVRESYENQMLLEEEEEEGESSYPSVEPGNPDLVRGWNYTHDGLGHSSPSGGVAIDRYGAGAYLGGGGGDVFADDMVYATGRRRYVVHPCLRSKRVRRGVCMMVAIFAILGISIGIARRNKDDDLQELEGMMDDAQSDASEPSHPIKFDRTTGWHGRTYTEALIFCGSRPGGYLVCPYEAVCPGGPDTEPLLGYATGGDANGDANGDFRSRWVPLLDGPNSWVQVRELHEAELIFFPTPRRVSFHDFASFDFTPIFHMRLTIFLGHAHHTTPHTTAHTQTGWQTKFVHPVLQHARHGTRVGNQRQRQRCRNSRNHLLQSGQFQYPPLQRDGSNRLPNDDGRRRDQTVPSAHVR